MTDGRRGPAPSPAPAPLTHPLDQFFAPIRATRAQRYASYRPETARPQRRAALTIVHNEPVFLPIWLRYYGQFFDPEDLHVLDNETTDGSTDGGGFVRTAVAHDAVDHEWMVATIQAKQAELLASGYDSVLVTDVDEIVAPDPEFGTLGDYLDRFDEDWVNCLGYEVMHLPDREPDLDLDKPLLAQRGFWFANDGYDKAALTSVPVSWKPGFHGRTDERWNLDPDLRLIHLHRIDYRVCRERHMARASRRWAERDVEAGWAVHNLLTEEDEFDRWFFEDSSSAGVEIRLEPIPPSWQGVV